MDSNQFYSVVKYILLLCGFFLIFFNMELFAWLVVSVALCGAILNSYGFYLLSFQIWTITNLTLCCLNLAKRDYAQGFLFFAYLLTSINGWKKTLAPCETKTLRTRKCSKSCKKSNKPRDLI